MKDFYVYQLRLANKDQPFYVGKGRGLRAYDHMKRYSSNSYKDNIIRKSIKDGVKILIEYIEQGLTESDAFIYEIYYISAYGRKDIKTGILSNMTRGGEGNVGHIKSEETRRLLSIAAKGNNRAKGHTWSIESKKTKSLSMMGNNYSKNLSVESRQKISASRMGKFMTEEVKNKISKSLSGVKKDSNRYLFATWNKYRKIWSKSIICYDVWIDSNMPKNMGFDSQPEIKIFGLKRYAFEGVLEKFKSGWIPKEDQIFMEWYNNGDL